MLNSDEIRAAIAAGDILIDPFDPEQVAQISVDLHLFHLLRVYKGTYYPVHVWDSEKGCTVLREDCPVKGLPCFVPEGALDLAVERETVDLPIPSQGMVLMPGVLYLGATVESIRSSYGTIIAGKSSPARKGLRVEAAGLIEPGFLGQVTLEIEVAYPLRVYEGSQIAQVRFHPTKPGESYQERGNYVGSNARGPVGSLSHRQKRRHVGHR